MDLPEDIIARLLRGELVSLCLDDCDMEAMDRYRRMRSRLSQLDAEIAALGVETEAPDMHQETVETASQRRADEERTYAAMDRVHTEVLERYRDSDSSQNESSD